MFIMIITTISYYYVYYNFRNIITSIVVVIVIVIVIAAQDAGGRPAPRGDAHRRPSARAAQARTVDFRNFIVFSWAETLAH